MAVIDSTSFVGRRTPVCSTRDRAPVRRQPAAFGEDGLRRAAPGGERAVERRMLAVVAAGVEARGEARRLRAEAADGIRRQRAGNPVRPQVAPVARRRPEPPAQLAPDRLEVGLAGAEDRQRDERASGGRVARRDLARHAEVVDRAPLAVDDEPRPGNRRLRGVEVDAGDAVPAVGGLVDEACRRDDDRLGAQLLARTRARRRAGRPPRRPARADARGPPRVASRRLPSRRRGSAAARPRTPRGRSRGTGSTSSGAPRGRRRAGRERRSSRRWLATRRPFSAPPPTSSRRREPRRSRTTAAPSRTQTTPPASARRLRTGACRDRRPAGTVLRRGRSRRARTVRGRADRRSSTARASG